MGLAQYAVIAVGARWGVLHDGNVEGDFATKESAFESAIAAVQSMSNADFAKLLPKLGPQANAGDVVYILVADAHEHLGQSVAYARENGIVPPWTIEAQKKAAEKKSQQKQ